MQSLRIITRGLLLTKHHVAFLLSENGVLEYIFKFLKNTILPYKGHGVCCHFGPLDVFKFVLSFCSPQVVGRLLLKSGVSPILSTHRDGLSS